MTKKPHTPLVLCILDGFGYREDTAYNAIKQAQTPTYDRLWTEYPRCWLKTSGLAVGLPEGQMGNSEVGHMNIGSGRVILQDLPRINQAIESGILAQQPALEKLVKSTKKTGGTVHLMGLLSPGGVHSHQDHILSLAESLTSKGLNVAIHAFLDGRDTPPKSALNYIQNFEKQLPETASIVTVSGRYWAMDRDDRWDRVEKAVSAILSGLGSRSVSAVDAIKTSYQNHISDEFATPTVIGAYNGIKTGDSLLMANFRADRAREILEALVAPSFTHFDRPALPDYAAKAGLVSYSSKHDQWMDAVFSVQDIENSFGSVLSAQKLSQLRLAETEKYAHVTFFFNGGSEQVFPGEDRCLIPSPDVATYDLKPEMSAPQVTDKLINAIETHSHDVIIVNFANPDMVGHTGNIDAAIQAVEVIDRCLARITEALTKTEGCALITADHGNVELMQDLESGDPHTAHTDLPVPALLVGKNLDNYKLQDGSLSDIAPTLLTLLGIEKPIEMTGQSLLLPAHEVACEAS